MLEIINDNIGFIEAKRQELIAWIDAEFAKIEIGRPELDEQRATPEQESSTPMFLSGAGALFSVGYAIFSDTESKLLFWGLGAILATAAYMTRPKAKQPDRFALPYLNYSNQRLSLSEGITKVISGLENKWGSFMERQQKEVFKVIEYADELSKDEKFKHSSSIYLFKKIDFPLRSVIDELKALDINSHKCKKELPRIKERARSILSTALNKAVDDQIELYKNLLI